MSRAERFTDNVFVELQSERINPMTQEQLIEAVEKTAGDVGGSVRSNYSGRGMFGKMCYGIVCDYPTACIEAAAENGLKGAKTDNMGRGYIVYWPHIKPI